MNKYESKLKKLNLRVIHTFKQGKDKVYGQVDLLKNKID